MVPNLSNLPVSIHLDYKTGVLSPSQKFSQIWISDLANLFFDRIAVRQTLSRSDWVVYEVHTYPFVTDQSDMTVGVTTIQPGMVGDEYFMTRGHYHERDDQPEIYHCLQGEGFLLTESRDGDFQAAPWSPGTISHISPGYAHRVVNTGSQPLIFVSVYHQSAGHNYKPIEERGFAQVVVEIDGKPALIPNPRRESHRT